MLTAAELVEYLQSRMRRRAKTRGDQPFEAFPPTWRVWMLAQAGKQGEVSGAPETDYVAEFAQRELSPPPKAEPPIGGWAAFRRLWRQQWERAPLDQRSMRRIAATTSLLWHILFAIFWLTLAPMYVAAPKQEDALGEAVQIEYIGDGTAEDVGAAPGDAPTPPGRQPGDTAAAASAGAAAPPPRDTERAETAPAQANPPVASAEEQTENRPSPPQEAVQPLVVTETEQPDSDFVLPPPVVRTAVTERVQMQEAEAIPSTTRIEIDEPRPAVRQLRADTSTPQLTQPTLQSTPQDIELREPLPNVRQLTQTTTVPELRVPDAPAASNGIVLREPATSSGQAPVAGRQGTGTSSASTAATSAQGAAVTGATSKGSPAPSQTQGRPSGVARAGVGESRSPNPGAVPSTVRDDDWGAAARTRPGSAPAGRGDGIFGADGGVRLPGEGRVGGGLPPGTIIEDFERIDRMGTWLKRPPFDYTPGRFDPFWKPSETLLEEWVRRGVKEVLIPIPGTRKKVRCVVSLLQAAGGCTVTDPNLQDQEAIARKPPPVPFKPELQEDQDGLKK